MVDPPKYDIYTSTGSMWPPQQRLQSWGLNAISTRFDTTLQNNEMYVPLSYPSVATVEWKPSWRTNRRKTLSKSTLGSVSPIKALQMLTDGAQLVDVREDVEWEKGHAASATHIPMDSLSERLDEIDKAHPVVVCCRGGVRSARAANLLHQAGFDVSNLDGGMNAWVYDGLAITDQNGHAGTII